MNRSPGTTPQAIAEVRAREFWLDHRANLFARRARRSPAKDQRGRHDSKRTEAALGVCGTLMPGNDEYNVIASENERVEQ
jgi:hypothetical protein